MSFEEWFNDAYAYCNLENIETIENELMCLWDAKQIEIDDLKARVAELENLLSEKLP
jgi:hypothetical protein